MEASIIDNDSNGLATHESVSKPGAAYKLEVRQLTKKYGKTISLDSASLAMQDGEFLTLLGPSGSGKTTLLSLIAGLIHPDSGEVWIDGKNATDLPSKKRGLGLVFQNYALFPHLTIYENIAFPLRMRRIAESQIKTQVAEVLEIVRLSHLAERLPAQLSGGQQQRVALARCFVYKPSIILMDEPLGALDKRLRDHMQIEIRRLSQERNASVIYVTHDQEEALVMSDRICLVNEGRIEQIGTPHQLYYEPSTLFAAQFIGESCIVDAIQTNGTVYMPGGRVLNYRGNLSPQAQQVQVMVRPENLLPLKDGQSADNELQATVEFVILTGAMIRIHAKLANDQAIVSSLPSQFEGTTIKNGDSIRLGFNKNAAIVIDPQNAPRKQEAAA
ncbi:MAG: ABC transporter ATP-binding protein [Burkholderiaceae bacterium]|nr:ABC transporter ATP-binding protein [Burkholderiaceae bacterium]